MRATLADSALTRYARRFVWLELDYDKPVNQDFIARRGVGSTPTLYVLDPARERAVATHIGGLTLPALGRFLDQGEREFRGAARSPAGAALARGDEMLGVGRFAEAAVAFREALGLADPGSPERIHALGSLTWALWVGRQPQACAEIAAKEAPGMPRVEAFGQVVLAGYAASNQGGGAPWAEAARRILEPLAVEASGLPTTLRDHRFQLYQMLMQAAESRGDTVTVARVGHHWLEEIERIEPKDDDERSALDIARVDAASELDEPARVLPALTESERAMPDNYTASLRRAQMAAAAGRYDEALAACDRGLAHVTGPVGRTWLLTTRANALAGKGDRAGARRELEQALMSARAIDNKRNRDGNVRRITQAIAEMDQPAK
jgi:tetratricopeptide (TPR) repeat protein